MSDFERRMAELSPAKRELLRQLSNQTRQQAQRIPRGPRPERIPLSYGQRRLWIIDQFSPGMTAYQLPVGLWLQGEPDREALRRAIQGLMDRHEIMRTVYGQHDGEPYQRILPHAVAPWNELQAHGDTAEARKADALAQAEAEIGRPFDLARDTPLRAALIRIDAGRYLLLLTFHHIAIDGWSVAALLQEFETLYNAACAGVESTLDEHELQVADVAQWQHSAAGEGLLEKQLDYWRERLAGAPGTLDLPTDRPRPAAQSFRGARQETPIPADLHARIERFAQAHRATGAMVFMAAYQALLSRYSGQDDVTVGLGVAGRNRMGLEPVVGFLVNTLVLRTRLDAGAGFGALVEQVREGMLEAMEQPDAPLDRVLEALRMPSSASHTPLAQAMFFYQNHPSHNPRMHGLEVALLSPRELDRRTAQADLTLFVRHGQDPEIVFEYSTDLFDAERIRALSSHLLTLLGNAIDAPERPLAELDILSPGERDQLARWNDTTRALPEPATLAALLQAQALRTPDAVALTCDGRDFSYRELDRRGNALAHALRAAGVEAGDLVGVYVERTAEMPIALLGILKAGGAYVPLDPSYPRDRLAYMLEVSGARVLVTQHALRDALPAAVEHVVVADASAPLSAADDAPPQGGAGPDDLAYVIFTSGSTGKPKGVEIRNRSAVNLLQSVARAPGLAQGETLCAISTLSFDIALFELVLPLTVGARIVLADRETARDGAALMRLLQAVRPDVMQATPATWRMLLEVGWPGDPRMKIISTGEALPRELADRLLPCVRELWNLYGPTETTVYSALCRVEPGEGPILVGRPVDNTVIHIVDRNGRQQPAGVPGELLIGGAGLAAGYSGQPALTAEKFVPDPFSSQPDARLYRTGDLALWRRDGSIEVIGRIDHQIKLRGFRIELGEIESVLAQLPQVNQAVVHCREDRPGDKRLVAYVTAAVDAAVAVPPLREHLRAALPDYMVPSAFVVLPEFPLTPNGKVDRRALPAPESVAGTDGDDPAQAPRTEEEQALAGLWQDLLGVRQVGLSDNFFDLGGHSLLSTRLLSRIDQTFGVTLPLRAVFEAPVLEQMAARIAQARADFMPDDIEALLASLEQLDDDEVLARLAPDAAAERRNG